MDTTQPLKDFLTIAVVSFELKRTPAMIIRDIKNGHCRASRLGGGTGGGGIFLIHLGELAAYRQNLNDRGLLK
jgi:hypothetical protein